MVLRGLTVRQNAGPVLIIKVGKSCFASWLNKQADVMVHNA